jgi:hypothetical protein
MRMGLLRGYELKGLGGRYQVVEKRSGMGASSLL